MAAPAGMTEAGMGKFGRAGKLGWVLALLCCCCAQAFAAPLAVIETVQMPAWRERAGHSQPLAVGMEIDNGDHIRTGADARVYLKLAEGSTVKLGERALLGIYSRSLHPARDFRGALDVVKGAFRFTTDALHRLRARRDIEVRVGTATVGIRGTDVWGKSAADRDLVVLIEGRIRVQHAGQTLTMTQPMSLFEAPRKAPVPPVAPVDPGQFRVWARETEILPGDGAARRGGRWRVRLVRGATEAQALGIYDRVRADGYAAQIRPHAAGSGRWNYEVMLARLASEEDAAVVARRIGVELGVAAVPSR